MKQVLCSGSLGDASIVVAKLHSPEAPFSPNEVLLTHATARRHKGNVVRSICEFYAYQRLNCEIRIVDHGGDWVKAHRDEYDFHLKSQWWADGDWEMPAQAPLIHRPIQDVDIVLCPSSGYKMERSFPAEEVLKFASKSKRHITLCGWADLATEKVIRSQSMDNITCLLNRTVMRQFIDILMSAKVVICNAGFAAYVAAMGGAKVHACGFHKAYFHPDWDVTFISGIVNGKLKKVKKK